MQFCVSQHGSAEHCVALPRPTHRPAQVLADITLELFIVLQFVFFLLGSTLSGVLISRPGATAQLIQPSWVRFR